MDSDEKLWLGFWFVLCLAITTLIISSFVFTYKRQVKFIDAGYTRTTLLGYDYPQWVKEEAK